MITKEEMLTLVRSVAVPPDVEAGMGHAFDLGADWMREECIKFLLRSAHRHDDMRCAALEAAAEQIRAGGLS
jgi:hypothetical protein